MALEERILNIELPKIMETDYVGDGRARTKTNYRNSAGIFVSLSSNFASCI
jgi:hypothetical protein